MKMWFKALLSVFAAAVVSACNMSSQIPASQSAVSNNANVAIFESQAENSIRVATWNVEHLAYPIDKGCKPRTQSELQALKEYARNLDADVVALQEVASKQAVELLFPATDWQLVMSSRANSEAYVCRENGFASTQQKVAFAVRKPLEVTAVEQLSELALERPGLRFGLAIQVQANNEILSILNVHLKSGCFVDDFQRSDSSACSTFGKQVPILDAWIENKEQQHMPYVVLGDFNHRLSAPYNRLTRTLNTRQDGTKASLSIATQNLIGCHPRYPAPIDHIAVGKLPGSLSPQNVHVHTFTDMSESAMLSDHCAVSLDLTHKTYPLSTAVAWQTKSQEYALISQAIYQDASTAITQQKPSKPWAVVMDVDETVLDNSGYQVWLDQTGSKYSEASWNEWVKSGNAGLVPGVKGFIETVFKHGGKIVLITNRNKQLDGFTWRNLQALNLPISEQTTCLLGRSDADKAAMKKPAYVNDKDLRREQVQKGSADCYSASHAKNSIWRTPYIISMQVGDNIEDIDHVLQESANASELLERWGKDIFILPNPMYGSW